MWTLKQAARVWRLAAVRGAGAEHLTAIACLTEGWAGAEIRRKFCGHPENVG
jgi:hypothetical protein